jgi:hypothetical protein
MSIFSKRLSKIFIHLLGVVVLVSCQTTPSEINAESPIATLSPANTPLPTKEITLAPTLSPTKTLSPTLTFVPYPDSPALATLLVTKNDILSPDVQSWDFTPGIIDSFFKEGSIYVKDRSSEIKAGCLIECTKQSWTQSSSGQIHRHLEITMIRMKDKQEASENATELFKSLNPYHYEYGMDEYKWVDAPTQNSHIGFSDWNRGYVLTTARGPIALMIVSYPSPYSDDGLYEVSLMVGFANIQLYKLKNENLVP